MTSEAVRALWLHRLYGSNVIGGNGFDTGMRRCCAIETLGLQTIEGLIEPQVIRQSMQVNNVTATAGHTKERRLCATWLNRHERCPRGRPPVLAKQIGETGNRGTLQQSRQGKAFAHELFDVHHEAYSTQ